MRTKEEIIKRINDTKVYTVDRFNSTQFFHMDNPRPFILMFTDTRDEIIQYLTEKETMTDFKYPLGVRARDMVTGVEGIITSRIQSLTGCNRYGITQQVDDKGKVPEVYSYDEGTLEILQYDTPLAKLAKQQAEAPAAARGGPTTVMPKER